MTQSKSGIAAAFAAGLAGGGVGGDQIAQQEIDAANGRTEAVQAIVEQLDTQNPTIKSYIRYASEQAITDVLDDKLPHDRSEQLRMLSEDIAADIEPGEAVQLTSLAQRLAEKTSKDWLDWYAQNFAVYLQSQISTGLAVGNLASDQLVRVSDVTDVMIAAAALHAAPTPPTLEADQAHSEKILAEDEASKAARVEAGTW